MPKLIYLGKIKPSETNSLTIINFLDTYSNHLITLI